MPLWLAAAFCVAIAVWRSRDKLTQSIDVERGARWLFGLMALYAWGVLLTQQYTRDREFDQMWDIAWSMATMASRQGVAVDSVLGTLRDIQRGFAHPVIVEEPEPPAQTVSEGPTGD